jgi:hypothetical protein
VVNAWTAWADVLQVSSHRANPTDRSSATLPRQRTAGKPEGTLHVRAWHRLGRRRLYVVTADGRNVGWLNVNTGTTKLSNEQERPQFQAAIVGWFADGLTGGEVSEQAVFDPTATRHRVAAHTRTRRERAEAPARPSLPRSRSGQAAQREWQAGAVGDEKVAARLAQLGTAWHVLHAIPAGKKESDADHLLIGPAGAFLLSTPQHPRAAMVVAADTVEVDGRPVPCVPDARREAARVGQVLSDSCGFPVDVTAVLVPLGLSDLTIREQPGDVLVVSRRLLDRELTGGPTVLDDEAIARVYEAVQQSETQRHAVPV